MAACPACGQRVLLGGRRHLRKMARIHALVAQLDLARSEAQKDVADSPPELRSALLDVNPLLGRLVTEGGGLAAELHEAAHHRSTVIDADRTREWEAKAERVLAELLDALELRLDP